MNITGKSQPLDLTNACATCLRPLVPSPLEEAKSTRFIIAQCGHNFHEDCLTNHSQIAPSKNVKLLESTNCPVCKEVIQYTGMSQEQYLSSLPVKEAIITALKAGNADYAIQRINENRSLVGQIFVTSDGIKHTTMTLAAKFGCCSLIDYVLKNTHSDYYTQCASDGYNPLMLASEFGHIGAVKLLIESGFSANYTNYINQTPLFVAARRGQNEVVSELLRYAPEQALVKDDVGHTPLAAALIKQHIEVVKILMEQIPQESRTAFIKEQHPTALLNAVKANDEGMATTLLEFGADVNYKGDLSLTILHRAVMDNNTGMVKILLQHGANPRLQDISYCTALEFAAQDGNVEICKLLLSAGAKRFTQGLLGTTDIAKIAQRAGHPELAEIIKNFE